MCAESRSGDGPDCVTAHGVHTVLSAVVRGGIAPLSLSGWSGQVSELSLEGSAPSRDLIGLFQTNPTNDWKLWWFASSLSENLNLLRTAKFGFLSLSLILLSSWYKNQIMLLSFAGTSLKPILCQYIEIALYFAINPDNHASSCLSPLLQDKSKAYSVIQYYQWSSLTQFVEIQYVSEALYLDCTQCP